MEPRVIEEEAQTEPLVEWERELLERERDRPIGHVEVGYFEVVEDDHTATRKYDMRCKYAMKRLKITDDGKVTDYLDNGWRILEVDWGSNDGKSLRVMLEYDPELDSSYRGD